MALLGASALGVSDCFRIRFPIGISHCSVDEQTRLLFRLGSLVFRFDDPLHALGLRNLRGSFGLVLRFLSKLFVLFFTCLCRFSIVGLLAGFGLYVRTHLVLAVSERHREPEADAVGNPHKSRGKLDGLEPVVHGLVPCFAELMQNVRDLLRQVPFVRELVDLVNRLLAIGLFDARVTEDHVDDGLANHAELDERGV